MRILLISYFFPPDGSVGGFRSSSICKYFYDKGIDVDLLTSNVDADSLEIKRSYKVENVFIASRPRLRTWGYKTKVLALLELLKLDTLFFFPDVYFQWIKRALKVGKKVLKKINYDALLVTAPPFSTFLVGYKLTQLFSIPLILDYRDPWNGQPFVKIPWKLIELRHKKWEKQIASSAKMIVTVSEKCAKIISKNIDWPIEQIDIIPNGFFMDENAQILVRKSSETFTIGYFGNIYLLRQKCFEAFLEGLSLFLSTEEVSPSEINIVYAGGTSRKFINRVLSKTNTSQCFKDLGLLTREETYTEIKKCHLTLLFIPPKVEYAMPTKIFDYMANNTHIYIIGNPGDASDACEKVKQQYSLSPCDPKRVYEQLKKLFDDWKKGRLKYGCNMDLLKEEFDRKNLAYKYADLIKKKLKGS